VETGGDAKDKAEQWVLLAKQSWQSTLKIQAIKGVSSVVDSPGE
jgi:hypothetical protein